ncbi:MAG: SHOCT domain-containing protein [Actinomycetota bacterium]|nr:SHOCT domain-containing protein [Actinomycetota bacterium]
MWWNDGVGWGGMGGGGWVVMVVLMVAFWALVIGVIYLLRRGQATNVSDTGRATPPSAESILDERFARGEIDAEEYQSRRTVLRATVRR